MAVKPRIKLDKKEAKKGDLVEVKALVSHVMETGQRKDAQARPFRARSSTSSPARSPASRCSPPTSRPAVSANPYIQFKFKAEESGPVVLTWTDDDGSTIVGEETITVTRLT